MQGNAMVWYGMVLYVSRIRMSVCLSVCPVPVLSVLSWSFPGPVCLSVCPVPVWSCLVLSGPVWSCLVLSGPVWSCLVLSGPVWSCLVLSSCLSVCRSVGRSVGRSVCLSVCLSVRRTCSPGILPRLPTFGLQEQLGKALSMQESVYIYCIFWLGGCWVTLSLRKKQPEAARFAKNPSWKRNCRSWRFGQQSIFGFSVATTIPASRCRSKQRLTLQRTWRPLFLCIAPSKLPKFRRFFCGWVRIDQMMLTFRMMIMTRGTMSTPEGGGGGDGCQGMLQ